jgi:hypothetical protein
MKRLFYALAVLAVSCKKDKNADLDAAGSDFGKITSAVVVVNPVINKGSTTTVVSGAQRKDVSIKAGSLTAVVTDSTGLAVIKNLPTGIVPFTFSSGTVNLNVIQEKELYDMVVSYTQSGVAEVIPAIRYPIGGNIVRVKPVDDLASLFSQAGLIIYLAPGTYEGNFTIGGQNILLFGSWDEVNGPQSIINGNLTVNGGGIRTRGIKVTGTVKSNANGYAAAFCTFNNAEITGNNITLLRNKFTGSATVPQSSSNSNLLDNLGIN